MKKKVTSIATAAILSSVITVNVSANNYVVQKGDNLTLIANKHNTTISELKKLNNMSSDLIYANQSLKVSASVSSFPAPKVAKPVITLAIKPLTYTVVKGDNLSKIASKHKITLNNLISWNKLKSRTIYPGQVLVVADPSAYTSSPGITPVSSKPAAAPADDKKEPTKISLPAAPVKNETAKTSTPPATGHYLVKSGDTLSKIALQNGVSVASLKQWNNLKSDMIYAGQKLIIQGDSDPKTVSSPANETPAAEKTGTPANYLPGEQNAEAIAKEFLGVPYKWAGNTPDGFDCSGFIYFVYNQSGKAINRYSSADYFNRAYYVNDPQPGDLVFFANTYISGISHMGIYIGNNEFIHASEGGGVIISSLNSPYYQKHFDSFKRFY